MPVRDHHELTLSGASAFAAERYRQALGAYHCYAGDRFTLLEAAAEDSPGFVMGYALKAYMTLIGSNAEFQAVGAAAFEAARDLAGTDRERGHVAAIGHLLAGELRAAGRVLEDVSIAYPTDVLALQAGQLMDFLTGDTRMLRDRIARALPAWAPDRPDYHAVLGLLAFGLEETGDYDRAEAAGRQAVELEPRNGWAQHAVAHVMEMQGRRREGVAWMRADTEAWSRDSFFQVHNWWHLALFHLGLGEVDPVLALFDGPIYGARSQMRIDMVDAAALLWRLHLRGVDVGERWSPLADAYAAGPFGEYAFDDAHAMMAFLGAGRLGEARALLGAQTAFLSRGGDNVDFVSEVGLPVMRGLLAFAEERYGDAADLLRGVRNRAARFGGSHAQRDLIDLTLIEAASRSGDTALERALRAERAFASVVGEIGRSRLAA